LFDEVVVLGAFYAVLEYHAIGQGAFQGIDPEGGSEAIVLYLLSVDLEVAFSVIGAGLEIA